MAIFSTQRRRGRKTRSKKAISHSPAAHRALRTASPVRALLWRWRWVVCALVIAVIVQSVLTTLTANDPRMASIVVANEDLVTGDQLTTSNIRIDSVPSSCVPEGALTDVDQAAGEAIMAPLPEGAPIFSQQLLTSAFSSSAPPGRIVTAISLDDDATMDILQPGDKVQLYSPAASGSLSGENDGKAKLLTNNAVVMSIKPGGAGGGLLGKSDSTGTVFVAIVEKDANLVIGFGAKTALHAVIAPR